MTETIEVAGIQVPLDAAVTLVWSGPEEWYRTWDDDYVDEYLNSHPEIGVVAWAFKRGGGDLNGDPESPRNFVEVESTGDAKDHPTSSRIVAKWSSLSDLFAQGSARLLSLADKVRIVVDDDTILETRGHRVSTVRFASFRSPCTETDRCKHCEPANEWCGLENYFKLAKDEDELTELLERARTEPIGVELFPDVDLFMWELDWGDEELMDIVVERSGPELRAAVASAIPEDHEANARVMDAFARDPDDDVRRAAAQNAPRDRLDLLEKLGRDENDDVANSAIHRLRDEETRDRLARDDDPDMRVRVAATETSPERLASMAPDPVDAVRLRVAFNRATPLATLQALVADASPDVRQAVASHESLDADSVVTLANDANEYVRRKAKERPEVKALLPQAVKTCGACQGPVDPVLAARLSVVVGEARAAEAQERANRRQTLTKGLAEIRNGTAEPTTVNNAAWDAWFLGDTAQARPMFDQLVALWADKAGFERHWPVIGRALCDASDGLGLERVDAAIAAMAQDVGERHERVGMARTRRGLVQPNPARCPACAG
jgi:hypothetical protein